MKLLVVQVVLVVLGLINIGLLLCIGKRIQHIQRQVEDMYIKFNLYGEKSMYSLDMMANKIMKLPKEITVKNVLNLP